MTIKPAPAPRDYSFVTERPGQKASQLQLQMLKARYGWAACHAQAADVLEAACGAGVGLSVLARVASSVCAGDIDETLLREAQAAHAGDARIVLRPLDALDLPFGAASFDVVLLFEALYYLPGAGRFFAEARRVLRPGGRLLITQVNPEWRGFHPSPHSVRYFSARELNDALTESGFVPEIHLGFPEHEIPRDRFVAAIRSAGVRLGLIPRTMGGKALFKRLFYGRLERIPPRLGPHVIQPEELTALADCRDRSLFRVLYATAQTHS